MQTMRKSNQSDPIRKLPNVNELHVADFTYKKISVIKLKNIHCQTAKTENNEVQPRHPLGSRLSAPSLLQVLPTSP